jgi:sensor histidine kinase YesM
VTSPGTLKRIAARAALVIAGWAAVVLFTTSQLVLTYTATGGPAYWRATFRNSAIQWLPWVLVAPAVITLALRRPMRSVRAPKLVLVHVLAVFAVAAAVVALTFLFRIANGNPIARTYRAEYLRSIHSIAVVYGLLIVGVYIALALRQAREREGHVARLEVQLGEARFAALQSQLHPHFLFNTLHGVSSLIHEDPDGAEDMLTALSDLLRSTLGRGDQREATLRDDLAFLDDYLKIHRMRLGDRLRVRMNVTAAAEDLLVPTFVIQPLVENAIRYAIAPRREGGQLEIAARVSGDTLHLTIADDGPGFQANSERDGRGGWGIGLANTRARLDQLFGEQHRFVVADRAEGGAVVEIQIPARRAAVGDAVA